MTNTVTMNRMANVGNSFQGKFKRVLCVCSAGLLRSPTAAWVLANEFDCNTRAAGLEPDFALIPVDKVLLAWADEVVCMDETQKKRLELMLSGQSYKRVLSLDIPDIFEYREPPLVELIRQAYAKAKRTGSDEE